MKFIQLKCPNCQADLEIEDTLNSCFCKYCGAKIYIADQSDATIQAKKEIQMRRDKYEHEKFLLEKEAEKTERNNKESWKHTKFLVGLFIFLILLWYIALRTL